jgi:hypothetical protein
MARDEQDKEDLLREATALIERVELTTTTHDGPASQREVRHSVVVGYRRDGSPSYFFGTDPVYQFNAAGELRRGFHGGKLLKAEQGRLVELTRKRTESATTLLSRDLSEIETGEVLDDARLRLTALVAHWLRGGYTVVGQVPVNGDVMRRVIADTEVLLAKELKIAAKPNAR